MSERIEQAAKERRQQYLKFLEAHEQMGDAHINLHRSAVNTPEGYERLLALVDAQAKVISQLSLLVSYNHAEVLTHTAELTRIIKESR